MTVLSFLFNKLQQGAQALKERHLSYEKNKLEKAPSPVGTRIPVVPKGYNSIKQLAWKMAVDAGITDPNELAMFMAQHDHESLGFTRLEESFNYKPERLLAVFKRHIKDLNDAKNLIAQGKAAIANRVYGNRMGNKNPGDGWKYRGRGINQLTGFDQYVFYAKLTGLPLVENPDLLLIAENAINVAIKYWQNTSGIVANARKGDVRAVSAILNTGNVNTPAQSINGLQDREDLFKLYQKEVNASLS